MVRTVLWWFLWGMIALLVILWLITGGIGKIQAATAAFANPLGYFASGLYGGGAVQLPWAVPIPQGVNISALTNGTGSQSASTAGEGQTLGNQSPYASGVVLSADGATASDPQQEYLTITNNGNSTLDISGWSLQSALTGARAYIPLGADFFQLGQLNAQTAIEIPPGGTAIVTTGEPPVGTSFRENECSGYLEQLQSYTPSLQIQCPSAGNSAQQAAQYGQACADYVSSLPFCTFPQTVPSNLPAACQTYVQTNFSYNGCVDQHENDANFASSDWRVYLDGSRELWNNDHDTIRLLDAEGETVAVTSY